jgi:hypothetical protein
MNTATAKQVLTQKEPADLYDVVQPALKDAELRDYVVEGSFAKNETFRYNCVRVIFRAIEASPHLFYSYWDRFAGMIGSPNSFHRSIAAQAIALLASADTDHKLAPIFNQYLGLINDPKVMVTHYFLGTIGRIYSAQPELRGRVIACLLNIDKTKHPPAHREMLKADIITGFDQLLETLSSQDKKKVLVFVKKALASSSPKTREAAKDFDKKQR